MRKEESEGEIFAPFSIRLSILLLSEICTENVCHIWEDGRAPIISVEPHLFPISTDYCAQKIIQNVLIQILSSAGASIGAKKTNK
jgi:hypothetical protein